MRTIVEITSDTNQCRIKAGMTGYIDGYVQAADTRPYAVVVSGEIVDLVPLNAIKVTGITDNPHHQF